MAKTLTIKEMKMWLEGVEEMQPEGWFPNETQWKRIREKIGQLIEEVQPPQQPLVIYRDVPVPVPAMPVTTPDGGVIVPAGAGGLGTMNIDPRNFPQPTMPASGSGHVGPLFGNPDDKTKTGKFAIDTSNGKQYKSDFAS